MLTNEDPHIGIQKLFVWSGALLGFLFFLGFWVIAGFIPPSSPQATVGQIVHFYASDETGIHIGLWMTMMAGALCIPFFTVLSVQLRRIEGKHSLLSYAQMLCGARFAIEFIIPVMIWQAADYRPTLDPVLTYRLHDLGWLFFLGAVSTGVIQALMIAAVILRDKRPEPVLPRWLGYVSAWTGLLFTPAGLIPLFKVGPLDWRGIIAFWLTLTAFGIWLVCLIWALLARAIPDQEREAARLSSPDAAGASREV
jgi:hypothetical protein